MGQIFIGNCPDIPTGQESKKTLNFIVHTIIGGGNGENIFNSAFYSFYFGNGLYYNHSFNK